MYLCCTVSSSGQTKYASDFKIQFNAFSCGEPGLIVPPDVRRAISVSIFVRVSGGTPHEYNAVGTTSAGRDGVLVGDTEGCDKGREEGMEDGNFDGTRLGLPDGTLVGAIEG